MNQPTTYEQLIAQKLQELDVPDHANAIWTTIEQQLNIEMPVDGPGSGGGTNFNRWIGGGSLFTFIIAAFTYILISKQDPEDERNINDKPATIQRKPLENKKDTSAIVLPPIEAKTNNPATVSETRDQNKAAVDNASFQDTLRTTPTPKVAEPPPALPQQTDTTARKKKPRGVRGITDADYRLVPSQKDSTKKKNQDP